MTIETADKLVALRRAKGLSQQQVAEELGVSRQAVSRWEQGETSPDTDNLVALLKLYGTTLEELTAPGSDRPAIHNEDYEPTLRFGGLDEEAPGEEERERMLALRQDKGNPMEGEVIAGILFLLEGIFSVMQFLTETLFVHFIWGVLSLIFVICMWRGKNWARTAWCIGAALWVTVAFAEVMLFLTGRNDLLPESLFLLFQKEAIGHGILILFRIAVGAVLLSSPSVKAFLYEKSLR